MILPFFMDGIKKQVDCDVQVNLFSDYSGSLNITGKTYVT